MRPTTPNNAARPSRIHRCDPAGILAQVKRAIREPYAWPGGYPLYVVMRDGEPLSVEAARSNWRSIVRATLAGRRDDWKAAGVEINWEDPNLYCAHTGARIESAYAEDEAQEEEAS